MGVVLAVDDDIWGCFQGPGYMSKYGNMAKNGQKIAKKSEKKGDGAHC